MQGGLNVGKTNLCVVGLPKQFTDTLGKTLASKMDMFYANIEDLFAYELVDMVRIEELCGVEYLQKEERSIVKRVCQYDNTLINIDYAILNKGDMLDLIKNHCLLIYYEMNKDRYIDEINKEGQSSNLIVINLEVFQDRNNLCKSMADVIIDCSKKTLEEIVNATIEVVLDYFA